MASLDHFPAAVSNETIPVPDWFDAAIGAPRDSQSTVVSGARIHYQTWAGPGSDKPGLLFVHGHAAQSHWWDFIAPGFAEQFNVGAIDLSGNGDSDHRPVYSAGLYAEEISAVAARLSQRTIIVGHSFGGTMCRIAAYLKPQAFAGLVLVDSVITDRKGARAAPPMPRERVRAYKDPGTAKRRFRLRPPQPCANAFILDYIAGHSLRLTDAGYQFKLDAAVFAKLESHEPPLPDAITMIQNLELPRAFIYGAESRFFPPGSHEPLGNLFGEDRVWRIEQAYHHVFLDQPLEFIEALGAALAALAVD